MTSFVPSSTVIGSSMTFARGSRKKKPVVGFGRTGHEDGHPVLRRFRREEALDRRARLGRDEHHRPGSFRELDQTDFPERGPRLGEDGREDLLERLVDAANHGHPVEQVLAEPHERASDEVGREEADQRQADEGDDQPEAGDLERR